MKNLIEKYFKGETSLQEEVELKAYFNSNKVEDSLTQYQPLFQYFENEKGLELSAGFEKKLFGEMEDKAKIVQMHSWRRRLVRVAAVAAVFFAAYLFIDRPSDPNPPVVNWSAYEIDDEQLAYEETLKALRLLSSKLNKGKSKTIKEIVKTEPVTKYLN